MTTSGEPSAHILPFRPAAKKNPVSTKKTTREERAVQRLQSQIRRYDPDLSTTLSHNIWWQLQGMLLK